MKSNIVVLYLVAMLVFGVECANAKIAAGPLVGGVVIFDTENLTVKSATAATGFFVLGTTGSTVSVGAVPSGTLTNDYLAPITLEPAENVMASTEFSVGISVKNLAGAANPTDTDDVSKAMMVPLSFQRLSQGGDTDASGSSAARWHGEGRGDGGEFPRRCNNYLSCAGRAGRGRDGSVQGGW